MRKHNVQKIFKKELRI